MGKYNLRKNHNKMGNMCGGSKNKNTAGDKPRLIFVVGGPGAGKGTACAKLVEKFGFEHLSTGDLLRAEVASNSEKGVELKKVMDTGGLVQTKCLLELLEAAMMKKGWGKCKPWLIDGFPRNQENVDCFGEVLASKITLIGVLNFELDVEIMKGRCLGRNEGRSDDNEATIQKRLNTFLNETVPVINKMKENGGVSTVDSSQGKEEYIAETITVVNKMMGIEEPKKAEPKVEAAPVEEKKVEAPVEEVKEEVVVVEEQKEEVVVVEEVKAEEAPVEEPKAEEAPAE